MDEFHIARKALSRAFRAQIAAGSGYFSVAVKPACYGYLRSLGFTGTNMFMYGQMVEQSTLSLAALYVGIADFLDSGGPIMKPRQSLDFDECVLYAVEIRAFVPPSGSTVDLYVKMSLDVQIPDDPQVVIVSCHSSSKA